MTQTSKREGVAWESDLVLYKNRFAIAALRGNEVARRPRRLVQNSEDAPDPMSFIFVYPLDVVAAAGSELIAPDWTKSMAFPKGKRIQNNLSLRASTSATKLQAAGEFVELRT